MNYMFSKVIATLIRRHRRFGQDDYFDIKFIIIVVYTTSAELRKFDGFQSAELMKTKIILKSFCTFRLNFINFQHIYKNYRSVNEC